MRAVIHLRHVATTLLCALVLSSLSACGDDKPPGVPGVDSGPRRDTGMRDGGPSPIDAAVDAGPAIDAGPGEDAGPVMDSGPGVDSGPVMDAGRTDAPFVPRDSGPLPDTGPPIDVGPFPSPDSGPFDPCGAIGTVTPCGTGCAAGTRCVDNGCGSMVCVPAGHACAEPADCAAGSDCITGSVGKVCQATSGCGDSRDCPGGFNCESGACVDRRIGCGLTDVCPQGFVCRGSGTGTAPFCQKLYQRCANDTACPFFGRCRDVDGDGSSQCTLNGLCAVNGDCGTGEVCGVDPERAVGVCSGYGPCAGGGDCATGFTCTDPWGDGLTECVPTGGTCATTSACSGTAVCASPAAGGSLRCIARPFGT